MRFISYKKIFFKKSLSISLTFFLLFSLILMPLEGLPSSFADSSDIGLASVTIVDKQNGNIANASDFALGNSSSKIFSIDIAMSTNNKESFQFTIPYGFTAEMQSPDNFIRTITTDSNGDRVYTYAAKYTASQAEFECLVYADHDALLDAAIDTVSPRSIFEFSGKIISEDGLTVNDAPDFTITIPPAATYSISQVDTSESGNFSWNPAALAGSLKDIFKSIVGIVHINNQAATSRPGMMSKPLQIEIEKDAGSLIQPDFSLHIPLPLFMRVSTRGKPQSSFTVDVCIDNKWKTMTLFTNAFNDVEIPASAKFDTVASKMYNLPTNMKDSTFTKELVLTLKDDLVSTQATDANLGTSKSIYEWFTQASAIRFNMASDLMWDPVYNGQTAESQLTSDALMDDSETYTASDVVTLTAGSTTSSAIAPLQMNVINGSDKTLKVAITTIDKIQMDVSTTKTTTGAGGANGATNTVNNGYIAAFGTSITDNYSYFTNMEASFDFPWEYSPTGTITLCPLAQNGSYDNERNLTCYDYTITISNTSGEDPRIITLNHNGFTNPETGKTNNTNVAPFYSSYTPDLGEDEWISNITVTSDKVWKQSLTNDTSALTKATLNHPLFYANYSTKSIDENGVQLYDGHQVHVNCSISTDQTGTIDGEEKTVTLIGPKDNAVLWSVDNSGLKWPIGEYGDTSLEYIELHMKKYSDTAIYENPYIEITGEAIGLLDKVTHTSIVGTGQNMSTNHLRLCGFQLNDGSWEDVSPEEAASLLNASGDYYDLSGRIPEGRYLTGLRLAPDELNTASVDTSTSLEEIDPSDNTLKHYIEKTYYLNLYDKVLPSHLGYDDTLKKTYQKIEKLSSPLSFDLSFHCDQINENHGLDEHVRSDITEDDKRSATLVFGDLPQKIENRDNNYYVQPAPILVQYRNKYNVTELVNIAIDDGPALSTDLNYWGEMQNATLRFDNSNIDQQRMLALTKGVSLVGANWRGDLSMYSPEREEHAIIRYKTNIKSDWQVIDTYKPTSFGDDRAVNYFPLIEGEYVTAIEIDYPTDFMYRSGYNAVNTESNVQAVQLPDVGLLTNGSLPKQSPIEGDSYYFNDSEQIPYHAELTFTDVGGKLHTLELDSTTAKLLPYPTMYVDKFTSDVSYSPSPAVYQGNILTATVTHTYGFSKETQSIDPDRVIHPTLCYQLDKNFTIANRNEFAQSLGIDPSQITLSAKNDDSGDSILKICYESDDPQTRDTPFNIVIPLTAKPNAKALSFPPIKSAWLTLDYDTTLDYQQEGEHISINPNNINIENIPFSVLSEDEWADEEGKRLALKSTENEFTTTIDINKNVISSLQFYGTNGSGGGIGSAVSSHGNTDDSIFGIAETMYAPDEETTNWVIYVAIPHEGQSVPYGSGTAAAPVSEFGLSPSSELDLTGITDANASIQYFIPSGSVYVPSFDGLALTSGETVSDIQDRDAAEDESIGTWKSWNDMSVEEQLAASYARVIIDTVPADAELSSILLMKLRSETAKTQVDEQYAYTSMVFNYLNKNGSMAFPGNYPGNRTLTNGYASTYVRFNLVDYTISGQLWEEKNFNNSFVTASGDILTSGGITLTLADENGDPLTHFRDGTPVTVDIDETGKYSVPVPCKGTYYLSMTSNLKDWLPVQYNAANIQNGMKFVPGKDKDNEEIPLNQATAKVILTNSDVRYINGGIEQWGTLEIVKKVTGALGDQVMNFSFSVKPDSATIDRTYAGTLIASDGTTSEQALTGGFSNTIKIAYGERLSVSLPVGLGYTVSENATELARQGYVTSIETFENGEHPADFLTPNPITASSVKNEIVELSYTDDVSDGGNVENFINTRDVVPLTGINLPPIVTSLLMIVLAIIACAILFLVNRRQYKYHRR